MDYNKIISKYWDGESSLEEEQSLRTYLMSGEVSDEHTDLVPMFQMFEDQSSIVMDRELNMDTITGVRTLDLNKRRTRYMFPKVALVAASMALLLMFTVGSFNNTQSKSYVNNDSLEQQEAYEITKEALAFLGNKYEKGSDPMKHLKELEKTNIFSF